MHVLLSEYKSLSQFIFLVFQFDLLEARLTGDGNTSRGLLRSALSALSPMSRGDVHPNAMTVARAVCRLLAGDELFQFFTREEAARSKVHKRCLSETLPNLYRVIIAVIMSRSNTDVDNSLTALGKHLSKCADRRKSKLFVAQHGVGQTEGAASGSKVSASDSSSDTD